MALRADKGLIVLVVAGLSTLSWWLPLRMGPGPTEPVVVAPAPRHVPDFFLTEFELTSMDRAGAPRYRLHAEGMTHYVDNDTAEVVEPRLTLFRGDAAPWRARSATGWVSGDGELVRLDGDVVIERAAQRERPGVEVLTDALQVWPGKEFAETERPVTLRSALGVTDAVGMRADFGQDVLALHADVRSVYAPR